MPRKQASLKVKVKDEGKRSGRRRLSIEINGDPKLFESSDAFSMHGAIIPLSRRLEDAVTKEVQSYWKKGGEVMDRLGDIMRENSGLKEEKNDSSIVIEKERALNPDNESQKPNAMKKDSSQTQTELKAR